MQDEAEKITPLAARVILGKKEAATSAIFVVILINMIVLVLVRAAGLIIPPELHALFWAIFALLLAADVASCPLCFIYAMREVRENSAAPAYTIAMKEDGTLILYPRKGLPQTLYVGDVSEVSARVARFNWNSLAGGSGRGYGTVKIVVRSCLERVVEYKVKYVADCNEAAEFIRDISQTDGGD